MIKSDEIIQVIFQAIDELNEQLPKEERLDKSVDKELFGGAGSLNSLGLVSLVTTVEQKIEENFGKTAQLLENIAYVENDNPFRTVQAFAEYVTYILEKHHS